MSYLDRLLTITIIVALIVLVTFKLNKPVCENSPVQAISGIKMYAE
mgnify:CR=1 FL=1